MLVLIRVAVASVLVGGCSVDTADTSAGSSPDGAALYARTCASCHGTDLRGTDSGPSHLSQVYEPGHHPDDSFRAAIQQGATAHHWNFGDMPPIPGLDRADVDAIIAYIRDQQQAEGLEAYPPAEAA